MSLLCTVYVFFRGQWDIFTFTNNSLIFTKAEIPEAMPDLLTKHTLFIQKDPSRVTIDTYLTYNVVIISKPLVVEQSCALGPDTQRDRAVHGHAHGDGLAHDDNL